MPGDGPSIAILGAGPIGLDAALAAAERGLSFTVYEAGPGAASHVRSWGHVRLFSPWSLNVSPRMRAHLRGAGAEPPDGDVCPTGTELVERVLEPVARLPELASSLRTNVRIVQVGRRGLLKDDAIGSPRRAEPPFRLLCEMDGREILEHAEVVLDCTGTYGNPNALGDGGIPAVGERAANGRIRRTLPDVRTDADAWSGRTALVVGGGHSAQTAVRDLAELAEARPGTRVLWVTRSDRAGPGPLEDDPLPERRRLARTVRELVEGSPAVEWLSEATVQALEDDGGSWKVSLTRGNGTEETVKAHRILSLTGYVGDHSIYRQLQVHECYATAAPMKLAAALLEQESEDCLAQESPGADTLTNPEPGFFILGSKSYGRNNTFLLRTGWQQVDEVFGRLP